MLQILDFKWGFFCMKMIQKVFFRVFFQPITTLNCCTTCISWEIGSYNTQQSATMNIRTFVAILSRNPQHDFPKMRGGRGQRPFGTFTKFHPFWCAHPSLREDSYLILQPIQMYLKVTISTRIFMKTYKYIERNWS